MTHRGWIPGRLRRAKRITARTVVPALFVAMVAGCSLNPGTLATQVQSAGGGQSLSIHFASVLNLTDGADVNLNGVRVGHVRAVTLGPEYANVDVVLDGDQRVPASARAAIRQSTVLGDSFVSLDAEPADIERAAAEDVREIPLKQTTAPPPLENTLAVLANFVNGGSVHDAQQVVDMINRSFPSAQQTARVADIAAVDMRSLAGGTTSLDTMLTAIDNLTGVVNNRSTALREMLSPGAMQYWNELSLGLQQVGIVLPSVGSVFQGGFWLNPMLTEVNGSIGIVRGGIDAVGQNEDLIRQFLTKNLFPFLKRPDMTIVAADSPQGANVLDGADRILRMLGAIK